MRNNRLTLCLMTFLLVGNFCFATTSAKKEFICPLDGSKFDGRKVMSTNSFGGSDSDFFSYPRGFLVLNLVIQTCPNCLCSFVEPEELTEEQKKILNQALVPFREKYAAEKINLTPWRKYEIAAACKESLGKSPISEFMRAAWCIRFHIVEYVIDEMSMSFNGSAMENMKEKVSSRLKEMNIDAKEGVILGWFVIWEDSLRKKEQEANQPEVKNGFDKKLRLLRWYHRLGYNDKQEALMKTLFKEANEEQRKDIQRLGELFDLEKQYQRKVIEFYQKDIDSGKVSADKKDYVYYQIADQNRRIGNIKEAKEWYKKTLQLEKVDKNIICLAEYLLGILGDEFRMSKDKKETQKKAMILKLIAELKEPGKSGYAAVELGDLAKAGQLNDDDIAKSIIEGLQVKDKDVRWYVAGVLKWVDNKMSIAPLVKIMLEDPDDGPRWAAAEALSVTADFTVCESFIKALSDSSKYVVENATDGLERLTNHSFAMDAAARWHNLWEENKSKPQVQWISDGFKKEGIDLKNPPDREDIPNLITALEHKKWYINYHANECLKKISGQNFESGFLSPVYYFSWKYSSMETRQIISNWEKWWKKERKEKKQ